MANPVLRHAIGLAPDDTVAFFRAKGYLPADYRGRWDETWQDEHARWFTVTKLFNNSVLEEVRASLDAVLANGGTFEQWRAAVLAKLGDDEGKPQSGVDPRLLTSVSRLRIVYDTNLRMSRAAGQWKRIQARKASAPYLMWDAVRDRKTRPLHRLWGGLDTKKPVVLPVDDEWWDTHFPPCGWGCRCGVVQYSRRDLDRLGLDVHRPPSLPSRPYRRSTGEIVQVPAGIDPGFAYNPGKAFVQALAPPPVSGPILAPHISPAPLPEMPSRRVRSAADMIPRDTPPEAAIDAFLERFGTPDSQGNVRALDQLSEPLMVGRSFFYRGGTKAGEDTEKLVDRDRIQFMPLLHEAIVDPDEIWWVWEQTSNRDGTPGRSRLTRRYVARFEVDGEVRDAVIVMAFGPGGWRGVSAFTSVRKNYAQGAQVRGGVLAYRRP